MKKNPINLVLQQIYDYMQMDNRNVSLDVIYRYLKAYDVDGFQLNYPMETIRERIVQHVLQRQKENAVHIAKNLLVDQNREDGFIYFTHLQTSFVNGFESSPRECIKLYIPFHMKYFEENVKKLYDFMFANHINFSSKVSNTVRCDRFVVRVDTVEEAKAIARFCDENYKDEELSYSNPFVGSAGKIGVARDTVGISYNGIAASFIADYLNFARKNNFPECNDISFYNYLYNVEIGFSSRPQDCGGPIHFVLKELMKNIENNGLGKNSLNRMKEMEPLIYEHFFFNQYQRFLDTNGNYQYQHRQSGKTVVAYSNEWYKLEAMNFMSKYYEEKNHQKPNSNITFSEQWRADMLTELDLVVDGGKERGSPHFIDSRLDKLYPDFIAYLALTDRDIRIEQARKISETFQKAVSKPKMVANPVQHGPSNPVKNVRPNIYFQDFYGQTIEIQWLPNNIANLEGLCTITIQSGEITRQYQHVYLDIDFSKADGKSFESVQYLNVLTTLLTDFERNKRMIQERSGHFGFIKYDPKYVIKKYVDEEKVRYIQTLRLNGKLPWPSDIIVPNENQRI